MVPEGWHQTKLGELFTSSKQKGKPGLPTMSVTLYDGLVPRNSLERKMETNLSPEEHLRVKKGYIAYNMMRMWQGASGLAETDALVSPAYVVLKPKSAIDPLFASYFFKAARTIYLFWAYSYGLTKDRLRLYYKDFSLVPIVIPPIEEQVRIAEIFNKLDRAIEVVEKLIENSQAQKQALMQELLTGKIRFPTFEEQEWRIFPFEKLATLDKNRFNPKLKSVANKCIELEHIEAGTGRLLGYCNSEQQDSIKAVFQTSDILFGKLRPYLKKFYYAEFTGVCSTEVWVFKAKPSICDPLYLYYLVQTDSFQRAANVSSGSKMPRADWHVVKDTLFHIPPIEEQNEITLVLCNVDREIKLLQQKHDYLKQEKKALMQKLLTGKRRVKVCNQESVQGEVV